MFSVGIVKDENCACSFTWWSGVEWSGVECGDRRSIMHNIKTLIIGPFDRKKDTLGSNCVLCYKKFLYEEANSTAVHMKITEQTKSSLRKKNYTYTYT